MKIVVISPHRDDAAFSVSLAIESWLSVGQSVEILNCFTRSEYAPFQDLTLIHQNDRLSHVSALREREDRSWCRLFGARISLHDLNLKDAPRRLRCSNDEVCSLQPSAGDKAIPKIIKALERASPDALVVPLALGDHVDHLTARNAVLEFRPKKLPCAWYEDLPYAARPGIEETIVELAQNVDRELASTLVGCQQGVSTASDRKRRLALCYDSQIEDATADQIAGFCERYQGRERLWVNPEWMSSELGRPTLTSTTQGKT